MRKNLCRLIAFVLGSLFCFLSIYSQSATSTDVMRDRIARAKAYVAVKNYNAAIYELDGIRRETNDQMLHSVVDVILIDCFLEQGDYKRAQNFLTAHFNDQKSGKQIANQNYFAVAGQVVKSARRQLERYRSLGLKVNDQNLPTDAVADLESMRQTLELVIEESKSLAADEKKAADAFALLEESSTARSGIARDDFDAKRWKNDVAYAREHLVNSRSVYINAADDDDQTPVSNTSIASNSGSVPLPQNQIAVAPIKQNSPQKADQKQTIANNEPQVAAGSPKRDKQNENVSTAQPENKTDEMVADTNLRGVDKKSVIEQKPADKESESAKKNDFETRAGTDSGPANVKKRDRLVSANSNGNESTLNANDAASDQNSGNENGTSPLNVENLVAFATQKINPVYPAAARTMRLTGIVRVELLVNEAGEVDSVKNTSGPAMLQRAALEAIRRWKFKPFVRDGQPVKAAGVVSFNFSL